MPTWTTHRSDAQIFADARKALDQRPTVRQGVHVHVDCRAVTLTGGRSNERTRKSHAPGRGYSKLVNNITVTQVPNHEGFEAPDESRWPAERSMGAQRVGRLETLGSCSRHLRFGVRHLGHRCVRQQQHAGNRDGVLER
jgi:hypothetical protein